jgi:hypothetical protein
LTLTDKDTNNVKLLGHLDKLTAEKRHAFLDLHAIFDVFGFNTLGYGVKVF